MNKSGGGDKTIFMGGPLPGAAGVVVPNPGGRIKAETPAGQMSSAGQPVPDGLVVSNQLRTGKNPVVGSATALLAVLTGLRSTTSAPAMAKLQEDLVAEIKSYDAAMRSAGVTEESAQVARYIACSAVDEAILSTPWGADSGWGQRSLLRIFHKETSGGEKFFALLNGVMARQAEFRDVLELFHVLLALGFKGRYQIDPHGNEKVDQIREDLFTLLYGGLNFNRTLSPHWQSSHPRNQKMLQVIPLWVLLSVVLACTVTAFVGLRVSLHSDTSDMATRFQNILQK